jgi:hypothetical protein
VATREQVLAVLGEQPDHRWIAEQLGVPPGRAYMIATGRPADGSSPPDAEEIRSEPTRPT